MAKVGKTKTGRAESGKTKAKRAKAIGKRSAAKAPGKTAVARAKYGWSFREQSVGDTQNNQLALFGEANPLGALASEIPDNTVDAHRSAKAAGLPVADAAVMTVALRTVPLAVFAGKLDVEGMLKRAAAALAHRCPEVDKAVKAVLESGRLTLCEIADNAGGACGGPIRTGIVEGGRIDGRTAVFSRPQATSKAGDPNNVGQNGVGARSASAAASWVQTIANASCPADGGAYTFGGHSIQPLHRYAGRYWTSNGVMRKLGTDEFAVAEGDDGLLLAEAFGSAVDGSAYGLSYIIVEPKPDFTDIRRLAWAFVHRNLNRIVGGELSFRFADERDGFLMEVGADNLAAFLAAARDGDWGARPDETAEEAALRRDLQHDLPHMLDGVQAMFRAEPSLVCGGRDPAALTADLKELLRKRYLSGHPVGVRVPFEFGGVDVFACQYGGRSSWTVRLRDGRMNIARAKTLDESGPCVSVARAAGDGAAAVLRDSETVSHDNWVLDKAKYRNRKSGDAAPVIRAFVKGPESFVEMLCEQPRRQMSGFLPMLFPMPEPVPDIRPVERETDRPPPPPKPKVRGNSDKVGLDIAVLDGEGPSPVPGAVVTRMLQISLSRMGVGQVRGRAPKEVRLRLRTARESDSGHAKFGTPELDARVVETGRRRGYAGSAVEGDEIVFTGVTETFSVEVAALVRDDLPIGYEATFN